MHTKQQKREAMMSQLQKLSEELGASQPTASGTTWFECFRFHDYDWQIKNFCSEIGVSCKMKIERTWTRKRIEFTVSGTPEKLSVFRRAYNDFLKRLA